MKSLTVSLFCAAVVVAAVNGDELDPHFKEYLGFHRECQKSTNTDPDEVAKIFNGGPINAKVLGPEVLCVHKKLKFQNDNGDINLDELRKALDLFKASESQADSVIDNCTTRKEGDTPENSAMEILFCVGKYITIKLPDNINGAVLNSAAQYPKFYNECKSSTNTDEKEIEKIFNGDPIEANVVGDHLLCMYNKFNIGNDNGDIDQEQFRKALAAFTPAQDKHDLVLKNCLVKKGATPQEVVVELVKCTRNYVTDAVLNPDIAQYQQFRQECISSTNTDPKEIAKAYQGGPLKIEVLGAYLLCMNKKYNIRNANGDIDQENLRKSLRVFNSSEDKTDIVVTNCSVKKEGATPQEVAVEFAKCIRKYVPTEAPKADAV
ncbi:unnamed protein product [Psylliodes chrysocephalus]|uniref:Uncharacterized protein n=1 Tax=Psylliodes chrysocephalus TaxID=3402493 RepID=A0A9P0CXU6_9CUCU|nr:unnamed protein product [Psylliodes chrysocephala]